MQRLEKEKDDFVVQMKEYEQRFAKIKTFDKIEMVNDTVKDTIELKNLIETAKEKIE